MDPSSSLVPTSSADCDLNVVHKFWRELRIHGFKSAYRRLNLWIQRRWYEWLLGISTAASIDAVELGYQTSNLGYQPIDYHSFALALDALDIDPQRDVFVDIGCGMGRAVILAACAPFRRVWGVELAGELCQRARSNLEAARRKLQCMDVEIVEADAARWQIPDDVTVVFMYNPFQGEVLHAVLENIRASLARSPRELRIVYSLPKTSEDALAYQYWLSAERSVTTLNDDWERLTIYLAHDSGGNGR